MPKKRGLDLPSQRTFVGPALVWKRIFAFIIDLLIINLTVFYPFKGLLASIFPKFDSFSQAYQYFLNDISAQESTLVISVVMSIFALLYFSIIEYKAGTTPGKLLLGIKVVSDRERLAFFQCIMRSIFIIPVFPFVLLWVIDPLFMAFSHSQQRLSEILSKTRTVGVYSMNQV